MGAFRSGVATGIIVLYVVLALYSEVGEHGLLHLWKLRQEQRALESLRWRCYRKTKIFGIGSLGYNRQQIFRESRLRSIKVYEKRRDCLSFPSVRIFRAIVGKNSGRRSPRPHPLVSIETRRLVKPRLYSSSVPPPATVKSSYSSGSRRSSISYLSLSSTSSNHPSR